MAEVHLSFEEIRAAAHDLAEKRRKARNDYETSVQVAAEAEREYHKSKAVAFTKARAGEEGKPVGESEILANAASADARYRRDIAQGKAKAALLRIEELEADRSMLRQMGEWSRELETIG